MKIKIIGHFEEYTKKFLLVELPPDTVLCNGLIEAIFAYHKHDTMWLNGSYLTQVQHWEIVEDAEEGPHVVLDDDDIEELQEDYDFRQTETDEEKKGE